MLTFARGRRRPKSEQDVEVEDKEGADNEEDDDDDGIAEERDDIGGEMAEVATTEPALKARLEDEEDREGLHDDEEASETQAAERGSDRAKPKVEDEATDSEEEKEEKEGEEEEDNDVDEEGEEGRRCASARATATLESGARAIILDPASGAVEMKEAPDPMTGKGGGELASRLAA